MRDELLHLSARGYIWRRVLSAICFVLLVACACSPGGRLSAAGNEPAADQLAQAPLFAPPSRLVADAVIPQAPMAFIECRVLYAAYALEQYPAQRVTSAEHRAVFAPNWHAGASASRADMAYAIYGFDMTYFEGPGVVTLDWEDAPPADNDTYIALGRFAKDSWQWFQPTDGLLELANIADYVDSKQRLVMAILLLGDQPATLNYVRIGNTCVVADVDLTLVFPPPLAHEIQATRDDWSTRQPYAKNYTLIGEKDAAGFLYKAISHEVDGYTHYGAVRVPNMTPGGKYFIAIECHGGASGCSLFQAITFDSLTEESGLRDKFIVIAPSFRGEYFQAADMGTFLSEGAPSIYDRDCDDALAMLDVVLQNYPEADDRVIVAYGLSRGAQVATRMAERDPRIHAVAAYCGFTDEWCIDGQAYMYYNIGEISETEPDPADSYAHMMWDLRFGSGDIFDARRTLLRASTAPFADTLPLTHVHYGAQDVSIHYRHGERLDKVLTHLGTEHEYFFYPDGGHEWFLALGGPDRFQQLLTELIAALE